MATCTVVAQPPVDAPVDRIICFLCRRKFKSNALLTRHRQLSELHARNFKKQEDDVHQKKDEIRGSIGGVRKQLAELDATINSGKQDKALEDQRKNCDLLIREKLRDYSQAQAKLESLRLQQVAEKAIATNGTAPSTKQTILRETSVGELVISAGASSWQGNKDVQEDRYIMHIDLEGKDGTKVVGFAVLDGHSGSLCVDALVDKLPKNLQKCLAAKPALTDEHLRQAVTEACVLTDDEFLKKAREKEVLDGSTGLIVLIYPDKHKVAADGYKSGEHYRLLVANIGDSRAVLCRSQNGRLSAVRLSDDHKPGRADERRRIEAKGGVVDIQGVWRVFTPSPAMFGGRSLMWGLAVSRAFGDLLMKEPHKYGCAGATGELVTAVPEIHTYELNPAEDRFLVLACDGIWDVLGDDDAVATCIEHQSTELAAHALIRRSFETGSDDNLTAMVVAWQPRDAPPGDPDKKKARTN